MPRWRLTIEYDGGPFVGWQRQDNGPSVQQAIEDAIFGFCGERVVVHGAGRTDAGVHAAGQVAHADIVRETVPATVRDALNFHLRPAPVAVLEAAVVGDDFHARFSARGRRYRYRILDRPAPPALLAGRVWWTRLPLDVGNMATAATLLVGHHDFTSFRSTMCGAPSAVKTLDALTVRRHDEEIVIEAAARSFLHNQVRIIAGTLKRVGEGKWRVADVADALEACDRTRAGPTAPPCGLYLMAIDY
ncbi:MAG TPA: tRNA pseudouridine(38-40) synthase TruA [Rhodospirillales bacterium]|nr:tRNA pseudouridine(38-40) synthase TruA [Rhodospirillales bacterium]